MEAWSMVVMGRGCGVRMPGILLISGPSHFGPTIAFGEYCQHNGNSAADKGTKEDSKNSAEDGKNTKTSGKESKHVWKGFAGSVVVVIITGVGAGII